MSDSNQNACDLHQMYKVLGFLEITSKCNSIITDLKKTVLGKWILVSIQNAERKALQPVLTMAEMSVWQGICSKRS